MTYVIDRIIEDIAVCESLSDDTSIELSRSQLPKNAREGDVIIHDGTAYHIDQVATAKRRKDLQARFSKLFTK